MENTTDQKSNGALISSIVIILILVIGGILLLRNKVSDNRTENNMADQEQIDRADNLSSSDDINSIEADLDSNSNYDSVDEGLK
jgi:hypothetical protein